MGLFSRLFSGSKETVVKEATPIEYKGYLIFQEPKYEGGQYRIAGRITKNFDSGEIKTHTFIRSDVLATEQEANEFMLKKAEMFIDQMGDTIFS